MANSRVITTRMAITGQSEYTAALKNINAELRAVQSSLKLTESAYAGNANSLAALTDKQKALQDVMNAQVQKWTLANDALNGAKEAADGYRKQIESTKTAIADNNKALDEAKAKYGESSPQVQALVEKDAELNKQLESQQAYLAAAQRGVDDWQVKVNDAQVAINGTSAAIDKNNQYLEEAKNSADGCATSIDENGKAVQSNNDKLSILGKTLSLTAIAWKVLSSAAKAVVNVFKDSAKAFEDYEYELSQVQRTTGMTDEEIKVLGQAMQDLSVKVPIAATELAKIATTAGQLGVANENILAFTEVVAKMATVTGQDADEVATNLARISNLAGISASEYDNLAAAIVWAGDQTATTATRIEDTLERISAVSSVAGFTMSQTVAIATTTSSAGVEAARAGTAIVNLFSDISTAVSEGNDQLYNFAMVAGMTADEFSAAWTNEPMTALVGILDGIKNASDKYAAVQRLGITDARQMQSIISWANSSDVEALADALGDVYAKGTALDEKFETSTSNIRSLKEEAANAKTEILELFGEQTSGLAYGFYNALLWVRKGIAGIIQNENEEAEKYQGWQNADYRFEYRGEESSADLSSARSRLEAGESVWFQDYTQFDMPFVELTAEMLDYYELTGELITDEEILAEKMSEVSDAAVEQADAIENAKGNTEEYTDSQWDAIDALIALSDQFKETYQSTLENFQTSPFETWRLSEDELNELIPFSDVMDNWIADAEEKAAYASNMVYLASLGLSSDLLAWLDEADQSTAAAYVAEIAASVEAAGEGTDAAAEIIADANAKYAEAAEADRQAAIDATIAKMDLAEEIANIQQLFIDGGGTQEQFQAWFYDTFSSDNLDVDSVIASLEGAVNTGLGGVTVTTEGVTADVTSVVNALGAGGTEAAGAFEEGVSTVEDTASAALSITQESTSEIVSVVDDALTTLNGKVYVKLQKLRSVVENAGDSVSDSAYGVGYQIINGMVSGMYGRSSALYSAVYSIVRRAISTANSAAQIASPSRETMKTGRYFVEGIEEGIKDEADNLYGVVNDVMKTATDVHTMMDGIDIETPDITSEMLSQNVVEHTGTIRVEGVNSRGELVDTVSIIVEQMKQEARMR